VILILQLGLRFQPPTNPPISAVIKSLVALSLKRFVRNWSDRLNRQGLFYEMQGRRDIINKAMITLDFNGIDGDYAEFGSAYAITFGFASDALIRTSRTPRKLWAFDSFAGLPPAELPGHEHRRWIAGTMKTGADEFRRLCRKKGIKNYDVIAGFYCDTLRNTATSFFPVGSIAFAYVDCDMYSLTLDVLAFLVPRLKHGMILAFDDYRYFGIDRMSGERRAFTELCVPLSKWRFEPYMPFGWSGMSFVVEAR
jgi:O-methyltransferase